MLLAAQLPSARPGVGPARPRCSRLTRTQHEPFRRGHRLLRCEASDGQQGPGLGLSTDGERQNLLLRLREDDVEYFDLKTLCRQRSLGGKDSKNLLRAKLLRCVRQELGLPVFGPDNVPLSSVCLPQYMSLDELRQLFESRGVLMPSMQFHQISMANALLIADGLLAADQVTWPDAHTEWTALTVADLKQECGARRLSTKGLKDDLVERLREWDAETANAARLQASSEAAAAEAAAAEGTAPGATNNEALVAAQELFATMHTKEVGQLREELAARGLKTQGTKQILLAKLTEALEKEVARALGGDRRLSQWAASAVARMGEGEVLAELEARGVGQYGTPAEAAGALQAVMQREWVAEALQGLAGGNAAAGAGAAPASDGKWGDAEFGDGSGAYGGGNGGFGGEPGSMSPEEAAAAGLERTFVSGRAGDPTLSVALVCGGHTRLQRDAALAAARVAAHCLQSDRSHGLLPQQQLQAGEGEERQGVAVQAFYAAGGSHVALTWEQLHGATAGELDARLALQGSSAADPQALASAADVVLPLGLSPACPALLAAAGVKAAGSAGSEAAAALAADRLAFASRAAELGFSAVPAMRVQLSEFADAAGAQQLADLAAYARLEAWAAEHLAPDGAPRLAVRAEASGSVLGGALVSGAADALLAALGLMQEHSVEEVLVEAALPGAHHFTCSVLSTDQGTVALPPTELAVYDIEEAIADTELRLERFLAVREGLDVAGVDALLALLRQEQQVHPAHLGGPGSASQQLRQSTPPAQLSAAATQAIRQASVKLFQELGLRDYAQFSGWVLQQQQLEGSSGRAAAAAVAAQQEEQHQHQDEEGQEEEEAEEQQHRGRSFAELLEVDAAARAEAAAAAAAALGGSAILVSDRAAALDTSSAAAAAAGGASTPSSSSSGGGDASSSTSLDVEVAGPSGGSTYGTYNGLVLDDGVRPSSEEALEFMAGLNRPIPEAPPPEPRVQALEDLSAADPRALCQLSGSGQVVAFALLSVTPDLASPSSVLCQQAAAVGLSHEGLLRQLVSAAAVRGGRPPLPPLPEVAAAEEQRQAAAAAASEAEASYAGWGLLGRVALLDEAAIQGLVSDETVIPSWSAHAAGDAAAAQLGAGSEAGEAAAAGGFAFVDATGDASLDPVARQQQAAWEEQQAAALDADISYDEIAAAGEGLYGGAAAAGYADPTADSWAQQQEEEEAGSGSPGSSSLSHMHPTKQRVWVLLGGDGSQRTQSLQSGLHAYLSLRNDPELLVEAYMLQPNFAGSSEEARRQRLLDRRLEYLEMGVEEGWILEEYPSFDLSRIRHPPAEEHNLESEGVWRLSDSGLLRGEVEDLQVACEAALATANASVATLEERGGDLAGAQLSVARQELELAGVRLDGSAWGGAPADKLVPAQYMWLQDFAEQAQDRGALVFLALSGQPAVQGPLQRMLEELGVPCTGSGHLAAETCADKPVLVEQLLDLEASGVSTAPQQKISLPELSAQCGTEPSASRLFEQLRASLGAGTAALCIKPAHACNGLGAMRATSGQDLMVYAQAVEAWVQLIPGEVLGGGADVEMQVPPPTLFVVEPFVTAEPLQLLRGVDGGVILPESQTYASAAPEDSLARSLHWRAGSNQWLQVSATLLGEAGRMRCLGPTVRVLQLQDVALEAAPGSAAAALQRAHQLATEADAAEAEAEGDEAAAAELRALAAAAAAQAAEAGGPSGAARRLCVGSFDLTPPPPTLVLAEAVSSARVRLEIVADRLGLSGAAEVWAYMHAETGELVISDVSTTPDLSPGALIFRQAAAAAESPLAPAEVFHELIRIGLTQPLEERDELQALGGYPELGMGEEGMVGAANYDFSRDSGYSNIQWGGGGYEPQPNWSTGGAGAQYSSSGQQ